MPSPQESTPSSLSDGWNPSSDEWGRMTKEQKGKWCLLDRMIGIAHGLGTFRVAAVYEREMQELKQEVNKDGAQV